MRMIIAVGIGGAVGTLLRFGVAQAFNDPVFPFGTLIANWTGCLGLAWLNEQTKTAFSPVWQKGLGTGLLGAYTTFSTLCVETHLLPPLLSLFYIVVTATGGLLFAAWGFGWPKGGKPVGNDVDCFGRGNRSHMPLAGHGGVSRPGREISARNISCQYDWLFHHGALFGMGS